MKTTSVKINPEICPHCKSEEVVKRGFIMKKGKINKKLYLKINKLNKITEDNFNQKLIFYLKR